MEKKDKVIDISWPLTKDTTSYKNKSLISFIPLKIFNRDQARETKIIFSSHSGTHIDAPSHFIKDGKTIEKQAIKNFIGKSQVIDLTKLSRKITANDLKNQKIKKDMIILFKTKNSYQDSTAQFNYNFISLTPSAAKFLINKKIKAVGIDYLGIERDNSRHDTHKLFLKNNIPIIEGLRLDDAKAKEYYFVCLPLAFLEIDAAPARAILIEKE